MRPGKAGSAVIAGPDTSLRAPLGSQNKSRCLHSGFFVSAAALQPFAAEGAAQAGHGGALFVPNYGEWVPGSQAVFERFERLRTEYLEKAGLLPYLARYRWHAIAALCALVVAAVTTLVVPPGQVFQATSAKTLAGWVPAILLPAIVALRYWASSTVSASWPRRAGPWRQRCAGRPLRDRAARRRWQRSWTSRYPDRR